MRMKRWIPWSQTVVNILVHTYADVAHEPMIFLLGDRSHCDLSLFPLFGDVFAVTSSSSCAQGKTAEEIRKTFNIVNDFTPEEEAQVREENKWCEDA